MIRVLSAVGRAVQTEGTTASRHPDLRGHPVSAIASFGSDPAHQDRLPDASFAEQRAPAFVLASCPPRADAVTPVPEELGTSSPHRRDPVRTGLERVVQRRTHVDNVIKTWRGTITLSTFLSGQADEGGTGPSTLPDLAPTSTPVQSTMHPRAPRFRGRWTHRRARCPSVEQGAPPLGAHRPPTASREGTRLRPPAAPRR